MDSTEAMLVSRTGRRSSQASRPSNESYRSSHRRNSNISTSSFIGDVEMAHDEIFSGPMSESVPTSVTSFAHQRARADSTASFTYLQGAEDGNWGLTSAGNEEALEDEEDVYDADAYEEDAYEEDSADLEAGELSMRRMSSNYSQGSVHDRLLRADSGRSDSHSYGRGKMSQKIYVVNEDLTIVVAGFRTNQLGYIVYSIVCTITLGLAYLVFRWIPKWQVWLTGIPTSLRDCSWVVIENQWGEFVIQDLKIAIYGKPLSTVFGAEKHRSTAYDEDLDPILPKLRLLDYRYMRFCLHPLKGKFVSVDGWKDPTWLDVRSIRVGIDGEDKETRETVFGKNLINIKEKTIQQLLMDEAFHPFYVFQIASIILWSLDKYYYYAVCIFTISVASITTTVMETRSTMKRLREISRFECDIRVLRNGFWRYISSSELVPGDVYEVTDPVLSQFPCDSLLLSGDCIVNESMLTGESVPVSKTPATNESLQFMNLSATSIAPEVGKHFLFCGTKIIRARRPQDDKDDEAVGLAMALRIGFNTTKGALVRSMLFPKPSGFKFYRDSFRYISVMACIALLGFTASFINFVRLELAWHLIIVRALDLITIVVPPALPATLTIGTNFALSRLRKKQIFCISPQRVNVGGKLDVMCFDKTGTLTEDGLDVLGVRVVEHPANRFSDILVDAPSIFPGPSHERDPTINYDTHMATLFTMATCHSLRSVEAGLVGDPLDLKMFEFTGWSFEEGQQNSGELDEDESKGISPSTTRPPPELEHSIRELYDPENLAPIELGILKSFEFVSQLRRSSVIVRNFGSRGVDIYVKGAPECMKEICRSESFPNNYDDLLTHYTHRGFRVIACARRHVPKLSWMKVQKMKRDEAESNLDFIGLIIFENKLKPSSQGVLEVLEKAKIRKLMCTGDNILTAISVARECTLIDKTAHCFVPRFVEGHYNDLNSRLVWESIDNPKYQLDDRTLTPLPPPADSDASLPYDVSNLRNFSLAISGDVFRWIIDFCSPDIIQKMLVGGQVFARMSPDEKHELVEKLQSIGYCVGFCGDGANDCGALKAADVGISLSEAEASVAAPFTSRVFDITCVPEIIREGRAALVTSFSCFKYMSLYSAIQFTSVSFLYASASNLGDFQFLFIDLVLILPIAIFMGWAGPYQILYKKRPTANLVSRKVLVPLIGQIAICILIQAIGFGVVQQQPWYIPPHLQKDKSNIENSQNTTLFLVSCFEYILSGIVLNVGPPFRQPMGQNLPFVVTIVTGILFLSYMLFDPAVWLANFMQLTEMDLDFRFFILALGAAYFCFAWAGETVIFPVLSKGIGKFRKSSVYSSGGVFGFQFITLATLVQLVRREWRGMGLAAVIN